MNKRSQVWYIEIVIALFIVIGIIAIFLYQIDIDSTQKETVRVLHADAIRISEQLISQGVPVDWPDSPVRIIGLAEQPGRLSQTKVMHMYQMSPSDIQIGVTTLRNVWIQIFNTQGVMTFGDAAYAGTPPMAFSTDQASVSRYMLYDNQVIELRVIVWQ